MTVLSNLAVAQKLLSLRGDVQNQPARVRFGNSILPVREIEVKYNADGTVRGVILVMG